MCSCEGASVPAQVMSANAGVAPGWSDWEVYRTRKQLRNADFSQMVEEVIPKAVGVVAISRRAAAEQWW